MRGGREPVAPASQVDADLPAAAVKPPTPAKRLPKALPLSDVEAILDAAGAPDTGLALQELHDEVAGMAGAGVGAGDRLGPRAGRCDHAGEIAERRVAPGQRDDRQVHEVDDGGEGARRIVGRTAHQLSGQGVTNQTLLVVEHNIPFITRLCQRIIVMANGSILAEGSADEIRKDARVLEAFLGGE